MPKRIQNIILFLSIIIPLIVALLLFMPGKLAVSGDWNLYLPHINGSINTITSLVLLFGFIMIKRRNTDLHKKAMTTAFFLGILFLISYILYHSTTASTIFGDVNRDGILDESESVLVGSIRSIYLLILLSHILLAIIVVPFVLFAFYFALTDKFEKHKKIVRFTLPIWLYVSVSGVTVYLLIRPYY
jgi:putative membrane protein